jgi:hypothetical protein
MRETGRVPGQQQWRTPPVYALIVAVVLEIVAGALAFLSDVPVVAVVLGMVGLVCLGVAGDALRISGERRATGRR